MYFFFTENIDSYAEIHGRNRLFWHVVWFHLIYMFYDYSIWIDRFKFLFVYFQTRESKLLRDTLERCEMCRSEFDFYYWVIITSVITFVIILYSLSLLSDFIITNIRQNKAETIAILFHYTCVKFNKTFIISEILPNNILVCPTFKKKKFLAEIHEKLTNDDAKCDNAIGNS